MGTMLLASYMKVFPCARNMHLTSKIHSPAPHTVFHKFKNNKTLRMSYNFRPAGNGRFDPYSDSRGQSSFSGGQRSAPAGGFDLDSDGNRVPYTHYNNDDEYQRSRPTGPPSPVHEEWQSSRSQGPRYTNSQSGSSRYRSPSPTRRYGSARSSRRPDPSFRSTGNDNVDQMLEDRGRDIIDELMNEGYSPEEACEVAMQEINAEIDRVERGIRGQASQQSGSYRQGPPRGQRSRDNPSARTRRRRQDPDNDSYGFGQRSRDDPSARTRRRQDPDNDRYGFGPGVRRVNVDDDLYGR